MSYMKGSNDEEMKSFPIRAGYSSGGIRYEVLRRNSRIVGLNELLM